MTRMTKAPGYKRAMLDWIIAKGEPMGTFGTVGVIGAQQSRADLARTGIDYDLSELGDLSGQSWCEDTYAGAADHPGLWALIVPVGGKAGLGETWFVAGEFGLTLDVVIQDVLEAGSVGDLYWKVLIEPEHETEAQHRHEMHQAYLAAERGTPRGRLP